MLAKQCKSTNVGKVKQSKCFSKNYNIAQQVKQKEEKIRINQNFLSIERED